MNIRNFEQKDKNGAEMIFSMYWTDPEFLQELSDELYKYIHSKCKNCGFIVAEEHGEIVGIAGYKELPDYLREFSSTNKPIELYIIASKYKGKGIGKELKFKLMEIARKGGFSEILLFSPESHKESWGFHNTFGFKRVGEVTPPEDDSGQVWSRVL